MYIVGAILAIGLSACSETSIVDEDTKVETEEVAETAEDKEVVPTVVGEWKMSDMDMGMEVPKGQEEQFATIKKEMVENGSMTINEDGTFTNTSKTDKVRTEEGTYTVSEGKLITTVKNGRESSLDISSLTKEELILTAEDRGRKMTMTYARK